MKQHFIPRSNTGKNVTGAIVLTDEKPGPIPDRQELHVVTDDGQVYRWNRATPDDPWVFQSRRTTDGRADTSRYTLPSDVSETIKNPDLGDVSYKGIDTSDD